VTEPDFFPTTSHWLALTIVPAAVAVPASFLNDASDGWSFYFGPLLGGLVAVLVVTRMGSAAAWGISTRIALGLLAVVMTFFWTILIILVALLFFGI
jgi:hypothetical protein